MLVVLGLWPHIFHNLCVKKAHFALYSETDKMNTLPITLFLLGYLLVGWNY